MSFRNDVDAWTSLAAQNSLQASTRASIRFDQKSLHDEPSSGVSDHEPLHRQQLAAAAFSYLSHIAGDKIGVSQNFRSVHRYSSNGVRNAKPLQ